MMLGVLPDLGSLGVRVYVGGRRLAAAGVALTLAVVVVLVFAGASARAEIGHPFLGSFGSFKSALGLGVDESPGREGNVYVVNGGGPEVVEVFNAEGGRPPAGGSPEQLTGAVSAQGVFGFFPPLPAGVVVDNSESVSKGDVYVNNVLNGVVDKFGLNGSNEYEFISQLEGFDLGITVDSQGDVCGADFGGTVDEYTPEGVLVGQFSSPNVANPDGVAVDAAGDIYVQDYAAPHKLVELERSSPVSTEVSSESTIAEGVSGIAFDRARGDLYVDFGGDVQELDGEHAVVSTFGVGLVEGSNAVAVAEGSGAVYVDSGSKVLRFGPAVAPSAPKIEGSSATGVSGTSATLQAQITPDWSPTAYHFEYGPGGSYGTSVPVPVGEIHAGGSMVSVSVHLQGLSAGTVYHYRVVASNEVGALSGPDRTFTTQSVGGEFALSDDRRYELVSPVNKHGGEVLGLTGLNEGGIAQASEEGDVMTYLSLVPFDVSPPSNGNGQQYVSTRGTDGWKTQNISPPVSGIVAPTPGQGSEYQAFSSDVLSGIDIPHALEGEGENGARHLSPEQPENFENVFLWNQGIDGFQPLVTKATPLTRNGSGTGAAELVGGSPDLRHVIIASKDALTANAQFDTGAERNLYEWAGGAFQLLNVLPDGKTTVEESGRGARLGSGNDTRNAVSADGSHVIWNAVFYRPNGNLGGEHLYESDMGAGKSIQVDLPQGGSTVSEVESEYAVFETASTDGSKVFFRSDAPLTSDASTGRGQSGGYPQGSDLYEYDVNARKLVDLTVDLHPTTDRTCPYFNGDLEYEFCGANVQGVIGASDDGAYVYVVANGVLGAGAHVGDCRQGRGGDTASCDLYLLHYDGSSWEPPRLIAVLSGGDEADWQAETLGGLDHLTARVSPGGRYLAFVSLASLTGYDNTDAVSGQPDTEVYLYDAAAGRLKCVSCNPTGARPTGQSDAYGGGASVMDPEQAWAEPSHWLSAMLPGWDTPNLSGRGTIHQPRYLSGEGRLFFDSTEALVPQDTNGHVDVYEYELNGVGSCREEVGCIYLISGGTGSKDSTFVDASVSGEDVFFVSASQLVRQDTDNAVDMYDARGCTDPARCFAVSPVPPPECTSADACRLGPTPQPPIFGAPASATFSGPGNPAGASSAPAVSKPAKAKAKQRARSKKRRGKHRKKAGKSRVGKSSHGGARR